MNFVTQNQKNPANEVKPSAILRALTQTDTSLEGPFERIACVAARVLSVLVVMAYTAFATANLAFGQTATVAGFAFGGDFSTAKERFPVAFNAINRLAANDASGIQSFSRKVVQIARATKTGGVTLNTDTLANLKNSDQAFVVALVLTGETTLVEKFSSYSKIFVNLRAEAILFDFKAQTVIRSYPINVSIFDAKTTTPTPADLENLVSTLLFADDGKSLAYQFSKKLEALSIPAPGTKTVQIRKTEIAPAALDLYPEALRSGNIAQSMITDSFSAALSSKTGVPLIPSKISHATGVMKVRFEDMYDYELKLPEADYVFDVTLKRLVKIQHAKNNVGASYIFGAVIDLSFSEPILKDKFLVSEFKNGEVAVVPDGSESSDDFPAYQDAIRGLFTKLSDAIINPESAWLRSSSNAKDIQSQIRKTRDVLEDCKK